MALNESMLSPIDEVRETLDPLLRLKAAHAAIEQVQKDTVTLSAIRRDALEELIEGGMSQTAISDALDVTRSRISQLRKSGERPERMFFGTGKILIAIGSKPEQGRVDNASKFVVSNEAHRAAELLTDTIRAAGLDAVSEPVPPPGNVNLNRPNLIALCSPRLLPFVGQVLASDPNLGFSEDETGWYIVDKKGAKEYRSPRNSGTHVDYAYIGRLPRPDGNGTFLYVAGIHAEGTLGAAKWLADNVQNLYKELKTKRFSTLVSVTPSSASGQLPAVERVTPIYRPEGN